MKRAFNDIKSDVVDYDNEDELISMEKNFINLYMKEMSLNMRLKCFHIK